MRKIIVKTKRGDKVAGIVENNEFKSKRNIDHHFRKYNGFGISVAVLNRLREIGIEDIKILFREEVFKTTVQKFYEEGIKHKNELDNQDNQLILKLGKFNRK